MEADPWAMIDKMKDAKVIALTGNSNGAGGTLATKVDANNTGAKTTADLAAEVALKAITKGGKFSYATNEEGAVRAAAASAVNVDFFKST
ncbi:hypothetical protein BCO_0125200 (plasmid) [Borrelia coriaceae ATCC 43381]|uniref:Variable large protein n=1 Tax=Borrelia coriaceae ATCC 43381 TaxID=1408429 RepID=W5SWL4_9SPIR|nr:hypothetical protein BCO_0125200 [Borrelia coriaceae ATCC 43381]